VRKPPEPDAEQKPAGPARPVAAAPAPGEEQGSVVTVTETLDPGMLTPLAPDSKKAAAGGAKAAVAGRRVLEELSDISGPFGAPFGTPLAGPPPVAEVHRYYVVYGVSRSGNRGGASPRPPVSLGAAPPPPPRLDLKPTEAGVAANWSVPPGARLPFQETVEGDALPSKYSGGLESAPELSYAVYLVPRAPAAAARAPAAGAAAARSVLMTDTAVKGLTWTDSGAAFGTERCYDVRAIVTQGPATLESDPSPVACVTPTDIFPPAAPTALAAVAGEGVVSLIWAGVEAPDLAGYLVLRGVAPDGALTPLVETPIRETTFRDAAAKPGVRYVYAVVAVDRATPPNRSPLSNTVEETAR
jgi:hypothetical protein